MLIEGSILPSLYHGFQHDRHLMIGYMGESFFPDSTSELITVTIGVAGLATAYTVLSPKGRTHRWTRTLAFIALGLSSVIPIIHLVATNGVQHVREKFSLDLLIAGGASYIIGAVL